MLRFCFGLEKAIYWNSMTILRNVIENSMIDSTRYIKKPNSCLGRNYVDHGSKDVLKSLNGQIK
jgi:hypothetical protein